MFVPNWSAPYTPMDSVLRTAAILGYVPTHRVSSTDDEHVGVRRNLMVSSVSCTALAAQANAMGRADDT